MAKENLLGKRSILFLYTESAYLPIGCLTSNDLDRSMEMKKGTATKCDDSPPSIPGEKTYSWSFDAVAIEGDATKASLMKAHKIFEEGVLVYWKNEITLEDDTRIIRYGKGYLTSLKESAPVDGEITFSGTIEGNGVISSVDLVV